MRYFLRLIEKGDRRLAELIEKSTACCWFISSTEHARCMLQHLYSMLTASERGPPIRCCAGQRVTVVTSDNLLRTRCKLAVSAPAGEALRPHNPLKFEHRSVFSALAVEDDVQSLQIQQILLGPTPLTAKAASAVIAARRERSGMKQELTYMRKEQALAACLCVANRSLIRFFHFPGGYSACATAWCCFREAWCYSTCKR